MTHKIGWLNRPETTGETWNAISGCTKISAGCTRCYAERMSKRLKGRFGYPEDDPFKVTLHPDKLDAPLWWKKPRTVFVCSMGDLFHKDVPHNYIAKMFAVMALAQQHTFLILTKRADRMLDFCQTIQHQGDGHDVEHYASELAAWWGRHEEAEALGGTYQEGQYGEYGRCEIVPHFEDLRVPWPLPNVWGLVTAENQKQADLRIPLLLQCQFAVRGVSIEPMLGAVKFLPSWTKDYDYSGGRKVNAACLDWIICGGETGPGARTMDLSWARGVRDQCKAAGVPYFFKQMSNKAPIPDDLMVREWPGGSE